MCELNLIDPNLLREWICPFVAHKALTVCKDEEGRADAIKLMCKMAPFVGKELTLEFFLAPFCALTRDRSIRVRMTCASFFGEFCEVVGTEATEEFLLEIYLDLSRNNSRGVRQACANACVAVAKVLTPATRRTVLLSVFIGFLNDESRWLKRCAYKALGSFIATFADPNKTGLLYNENDGTWILSHNENYENYSVQSEDDSEGLDVNPSEDVVTLYSRRFSEFDYGSEMSSIEQRISSEQNSVLARLAQKVNEQRYGRMPANCNSSAIDAQHFDVQKSSATTSQNSSGDGLFSYSLKEDHVPEADYRETECKSICNTDSQHIFHPTSRNEDNIPVPDEINSEGKSRENSLSVTAKGGHLHLHLDNESIFNNFQFWRLPLPEIELGIETENGHATTIHVRATARDGRTNLVCSSDFKVDISSCISHQASKSGTSDNSGSQSESSEEASSDDGNVVRSEGEVKQVFVRTASISTVVNPSADHVSNSDVIQSLTNEASLTIIDGELIELKQFEHDLCNSDQKSQCYPYDIHSTSTDSMCSERAHDSSFSKAQYTHVYEQDIVPPELLEKYINMVDPVLSYVDSEITLLCAYNLPAVAYTLGRRNWICLSKVCEILASDMEWKVRRTIAASLHELAAVLGGEMATIELQPLFFTLINDLDEVRAGIIQNLAEFLKHLPYKSRKKFLPQMRKFLKMDNEHNWRFRQMFVKQLIPITKLYSQIDVNCYIYPVGMILIRDRVCEVRMETMRLIAVIVSYCSEYENIVRNVLKDLEDMFSLSHKWLWRQMYVLICQQFAVECSLSPSVFAQRIAGKLLSLAWDGVPNVRLAVARCLFEALPLDYLNEIERLHGDMLFEVASLLRDDVDRDVRFYANMSTATHAAIKNMLSPV